VSNIVVHIVISGFRKPGNYHTACNTRIFNFLFTKSDHLHNKPDL